MSRTLKEIMDFQAEFDKTHIGAVPFFEELSEDNVEVLEHLIVCLIGEVGELANIAKKIRRGDFLLEQQRSNISEEVADVFIYLMKIAGQTGTDLEVEYFKKMRVNKERFRAFEDDDAGD